MSTLQEKNKALVLEASDTLFNNRDYAAAERHWSPNYIQHSAHIEPSREGLFNLIKGIPASLRYEAGTIVADGDFVIVHGPFSGFGATTHAFSASLALGFGQQNSDHLRISRTILRAYCSSFLTGGYSLATPTG